MQGAGFGVHVQRFGHRIFGDEVFRFLDFEVLVFDEWKRVTIEGPCAMISVGGERMS